MKRFVLLLGVTALGAAPGYAETAHIAVAANFTAVAEALARDYAAQSGHEIVLSFGATGLLYTQIVQGAPFDAFLAADVDRPEQALAEGLGVEGTSFVYALGQLALYAPGREAGEDTLRGDYNKLAIADPQLAPYGRAAMEVLTELGLFDELKGKFVQGENISQTLQFVESGNAELGFVALSQVADKAGVWRVPEALHSPIAQRALLLKRGENNAAAAGFLQYIASEDGVTVIEKAGYAVP